jgi:hypothetical protein
MADFLNRKSRSLDSLRYVLREAGIRVTATRVAVSDELGAADSFVSHSEILETLRPRGFDGSTVFRGVRLDQHGGAELWRSGDGEVGHPGPDARAAVDGRAARVYR